VSQLKKTEVLQNEPRQGLPDLKNTNNEKQNEPVTPGMHNRDLTKNNHPQYNMSIVPLSNFSPQDVNGKKSKIGENMTENRGDNINKENNGVEIIPSGNKDKSNAELPL
jgi:hypothetical protein